MKCTIDINNLNYLLNIGDTRVLSINGLIERGREENVHFDQTNPFRNIVSFDYYNNQKEIQNISTILVENSSYPNLVEISLKRTNFNLCPLLVPELIPNLQSLEIQKNDLDIPPEMFPWTQDMVLLPRNLSRSPFAQSEYTASDYIEIPSNIFQRSLNLDGNKIQNLSDYMFRGQIDKISLQRNNLHTFGSNTFRNTYCLQYLDLRNNIIEDIPQGSFNGMKSLKKLELSGNKLRNMLSSIFDDQIYLKFLSLANNVLETIPSGMFENLQKLEILRLENNQLYDISHSSFPLNSVYLKEIHFQFNPLTDLPHFLFYIKNIRLVNFQGTLISFKNINELARSSDFIRMLLAIINFDRHQELRKVDMSDCNITSIHMTENTTIILATLLRYFKFELRNNPIICDCKIWTFLQFIKESIKNGTIHGSFFYDWTCESPRDFNGRKMLSLKPEETYCEVAIPKCPQECTCYDRPTEKHIIVDCRNEKLSNIHRDLPDGKLELWYDGNVIVRIISLPSPENVVVFDVSENKIETISDEVIRRMKNLKVLRLNSNMLAYLPQEITLLNLEQVSIEQNPFTCDCETFWMKAWLEKKKHVVKDWYKVACKIENEKGKALVEVPKEQFICNQEFDEARIVVLPVTVSSAFLLFLVISVLLLYAYRLECKVLIFVYFGIHPFDRDSKDHIETLDCVIVHSGLETDWVMDNIVPLLENKNFVVCDMARDFVVGYSFQENLTNTVRQSKRVIFCLSEDWKTSSDSFTTAWRIAREKIKDTRSHYGIIVSHEIKKNDIHNQELRRFIEKGRFVDSKDKLFGNKIIYYMPQIRRIRSKMSNTNLRNISFRCFINSCSEDTVTDRTEQQPHTSKHQQQTQTENVETKALSHAFISYHDDDFEYVLKEILPFLEENGFSYCIADKDFVPGASIEENVLNAIDRSNRTIFLLSPLHLENEWSLFTFRAAYEKALREKSNHLIVIVKEETEEENLDKEIRYYLNNYICLNSNDRWFEQKLLNGLPVLEEREGLHASPLFLTGANVNENDVEIEVQ